MKDDGHGDHTWPYTETQASPMQMIMMGMGTIHGLKQGPRPHLKKLPPYGRLSLMLHDQNQKKMLSGPGVALRGKGRSRK